MKAATILTGTIIALSMSLGSMIHCAASQFPAVGIIDYRSNLPQESIQIHELWRADLQRSSVIELIEQKLMRRRPSERSKLILLKMLDGLLDSVRWEVPVIMMGGPPDVEAESIFHTARDEAQTLIRIYREYVVLSARQKEQLVKTKDLEPTGVGNLDVSNSTREHLLVLVGEQALARLDRELQEQ